MLAGLPLRAVMCELHRTSCGACGCEIPGAQTCWVSRKGAPDPFIFCHSCGGGVMYWYGLLTVDQLDQVPPWCGASQLDLVDVNSETSKAVG